MCTVPLPPDVNPIAVKYIYIYHIFHKYHINTIVTVMIMMMMMIIIIIVKTIYWTPHCFPYCCCLLAVSVSFTTYCIFSGSRNVMHNKAQHSYATPRIQFSNILISSPCRYFSRDLETRATLSFGEFFSSVK
jgi:hypothetical protein